ncbi:MAG: hypothetical protein JWL85_477 [Candidatus Saccharibacteria bacterium]|nr:hypothetical protein [Candidatus Saccharibacteria bacterium]
MRERGFTLVEVLIMTPILMLTIIVMTSFLFSQYGQLTQQGALLNLQVESQNITFSMQDDIFFADSFATTINSNLIDDHAPTGGWNNATTPPTLIISTPALTANRRSENRQPVYINTQGCTPDVIQENSPLYNNVIYFAQGTRLYKRIVSAPITMSTCGSSYFKQSCPEPNSSSSCPPDRLVTDKLDSFNLTYYDANNAVVTDPNFATKVKVDLQLKDKAFAEDIHATSSLTLKKLNQ